MKYYKINNPSLSRDFTIIALIIFILLMLLSVWFTFFIQTDHQDHYNTRLYFSANRIQRVLINELEYIEKQMMEIAVKVRNLPEADLDVINQELRKLYTQNNFIIGTNRNMFSWISTDKKMLVHGEFGILKKPIEVNSRNYIDSAIQNPGQIFYGHPTFGATSHLRILPIGVAIKSENGKMLGILNYSFDLDSLLFKLEKASMMPHAAFAIIKEDQETILQSSCCNRLANEINFHALLKKQEEQNAGLLTHQSLLNSDVPFTYFMRVPNYPFTVLVIYDSKISYIKLRNLWISKISEFLIFAILIFLSLYIIKRRIIKPLLMLSKMSDNLYQGYSDIPLQDFKSQELQNLSEQLHKLASYIKEEKIIKQELSQKTLALEKAKKSAEQNEIAERISRMESERSRQYVKLAYQHLEYKVKERTIQLEEALKAKTEFLNNISHEVRTPIHGVINYIDFLLEEWEVLSEKERYEIAEKICKNSHRLHTLVNNLLDLAKYGANKMSFNFQNESINELAKEVIEELESLYKINKDLEVILEAPSVINAEVDAERIKQILRNLIANSIKFTRTGYIKVSLSYTNLFSNDVSLHDAVQISVKDSGIGIPENELNEIFAAFSQSSRTKTRAGGTGLGLTISKEIILSHHGKIWAENNIDGGACFSFVIPLKQPNIEGEE